MLGEDELRKRSSVDEANSSGDKGVDNVTYKTEDGYSCMSWENISHGSDNGSSFRRGSDGNEHFEDVSEKGKTTLKVNTCCTNFLTDHLAVLYCFICALITSLASIGVAALSGSVSSNEINFIRMAIQLLACLPVAVHQRIRFGYSRKAYLLLISRSVIGAFNSTLYFLIYQIMPVATAKAIQYTYPIFAGLLGWVLLKESCSFIDTFLSFISFGGVILVVQPPFIFESVEGVEPIPDSTILGSILSLFNAFLTGLTLIIIRKLTIYGMSPLAVLIVYSVIGMIVSGGMTTILGQWTIPQCGLDRFTLIGNGILLVVIQVLEYIALKTERASTVGLIRSSDIIFSFILEFIFFNIRPNSLTIVGALVIMACLVGLTVKKGCDKQSILEDDELSTS